MNCHAAVVPSKIKAQFCIYKGVDKSIDFPLAPESPASYLITAMSRLHLTGRKLRILAFSIGVLTMLLSDGVISAEVFTKGKESDPFTKLQNGEYSWHPEVSPEGPVLIIVSIPEQRLFVYRNGVRIGKSTISSGRPGHRTPTGVFTILEKEVDHTSTIYKGASMPYMERLTWGGIALHAGYLPGYSDSHGCVRLPLEFAKKLFTVTGKGTTVMITDGSPTPVSTAHPGYFLSDQGKQPLAKTDQGDFEWNPEEAPAGPVTIVVSTKSSRMYVFRNGIEIGRAVLQGSEDLNVGTYAYTALSTLYPDGRHHWSSINVGGDHNAPDLHDLSDRLGIPPVFRAKVHDIIEPGTTLVISDAPVNRASPVDTGVNVLTTDESSKR